MSGKDGREQMYQHMVQVMLLSENHDDRVRAAVKSLWKALADEEIPTPQREARPAFGPRSPFDDEREAVAHPRKKHVHRGTEWAVPDKRQGVTGNAAHPA
jgi:hypothetical protein